MLNQKNGNETRIDGTFPGAAPYVRDVVELSDYVMPVIRTCKPVFTLYLWAEVSEKQHSWVVLTHKD